ncbi:MAG: NADH:ubiquinone reductase (Na(+)-transporting) subunit B [Bacteriovoracaceae bacterium]|mgnify:CR=1 FL=1|jgi:Na+-transporting NADH:ubiquinone oxidoreductase subunit B|nr:NADH:ubiquinone reductase (Na(+)-transporting) subunit B [Bacteriovoracaceae bacterium]
MKFLRDTLDKVEPHFEKGGKWEKFFVIYEMADTFLYTPSDVSRGRIHLRDGLDLKRMMITVVMALLPCILMAMYNTGLQANTALEGLGANPEGWRYAVMSALGLGLNSSSCLSNFILGSLYFIPIFLVTQIAGGFWEVLFASVRGHEINEGFLVTGMLFPLIVPATIPLWQVAVGISFGVVFGKEVFGGTGRNILNPALVGRAFLFFAYPAQISGDAVWTAVEGFSGATPLAQAAANGISGITYTWNQAFMGFIPGSMGETSTIACLFGAAVLIISGIGSWRIMLSTVLGMALMSLIFNAIGSETNMMFNLPFQWHFVLGGFAFAAVFMATDPVSAANTLTGQFVYGFLIGIMGMLIRVANPAYPEGWMLAVLFGNTFSPLIDYFVVKNNIKRRMAQHVS